MSKLAKWNGAVIAKSDNCKEVEGNLYFPIESVDKSLLKESSKTSFCGWKGTANYYNIEVDGAVNADAAWFYKEPYEKAIEIKDHVAFWNGVEVVDG